MQSLAWSTILLLVLLVPGFAFAVGFSAPAGYGRDATPRNPLAALTLTVIVAVFVHAIMSLVLGKVAERTQTPSLRVEWGKVADAVQLPSPPAGATPDIKDGDTAAERVGRELSGHGWQIALYVVGSALAGLVLGFYAGKPFAEGRWSHLQEHPWASRIRTAETRNASAINYAHVLADVSHQGGQLLYRGRVMYFSLRNDGSFASIVLAATEQRMLDLTGNAPRPGPRRSIGGSGGAGHPRANVGGAAPLGGWRRRPRPGRIDEAGAVMVIAGSNIKGVVFQDTYEIREIDKAAKLVSEMSKALAAGDLKGAEKIRKKLKGVGGRTPAANAPQRRTLFGPVREAQWLLSTAGLYDGPVDGLTGPLTREAVRLYQKHSGLSVDGIPGARTLEHLRKEYGG